jgi:hypothetical protein
MLSTAARMAAVAKESRCCTLVRRCPRGEWQRRGTIGPTATSAALRDASRGCLGVPVPPCARESDDVGSPTGVVGRRSCPYEPATSARYQARTVSQANAAFSRHSLPGQRCPGARPEGQGGHRVERSASGRLHRRMLLARLSRSRNTAEGERGVVGREARWKHPAGPPHGSGTHEQRLDGAQILGARAARNRCRRHLREVG